MSGRNAVRERARFRRLRTASTVLVEDADDDDEECQKAKEVRGAMQASPMAVTTLNNFALSEAIYKLLRELLRRPLQDLCPESVINACRA
jgi:hypothetical protein